MRWNIPSANEEMVEVLARKLNVSPPIARILFRQGYRLPAEAEAFLNPQLRSLGDPFLLTGMAQAVARLRQAMARQEQILVFGDYDVDGVTSTAFLISVLQIFGQSPRFIVPKRLEEGYGLSLGALERALEAGLPRLLIAVDCGTNSQAEVAFLRQRGIDVIILDHHVSKGGLPTDCVVVNPHVNDGDNHPWSHLCTVGLVFKFIHALLKQLRQEGDELAEQVRLRDYLDFVALGTIADLVPLHGENRILAKSGLGFLRESHRPGINALLEVCGLKLGDPITPWDIAFRLGPRINASGRLADATIPIQMLLATDWRQCLENARLLDGFNRERQDIEKAIVTQAEAEVETTQKDAAGLVLFHPDWHPGVVGIVASRISQKYHRPCLVLGREGEMARGSGRSIPSIDLVQTLQPCAHLLAHWGGHPMAVGISLLPARLAELRESFSRSVLDHSGGSLPEPLLQLASWIEPSDLTVKLLEELDRLTPFGQGNPEPVFGLRRVVLRNPPTRFGQGHSRFVIEVGGGPSVPAVAWKMAAKMPDSGSPVDLAVRFQWNDWNGRRAPQAILVDWRPAR